MDKNIRLLLFYIRILPFAAVFPGRAPHDFPKSFSKVAAASEAAGLADIRNRQTGIREHDTGLPDSEVFYVF